VAINNTVVINNDLGGSSKTGMVIDEEDMFIISHSIIMDVQLKLIKRVTIEKMKVRQAKI